jgi:hypothetical protein
MTIVHDGCTFDSQPPEDPTKDQNGRPAVKLGICKLWLNAMLDPNPRPVRDLRKEAETEGYAANTFYKAAEALGLEEFTVDKRKWWKLPHAS